MTNDNGSYVKPFSLDLTLAQAQRFAADINALAVDHPGTTTGLAGFPDVTLTFQTAHGPRAFLVIRNAYLVQSLGGGPDLIMSGSLNHELTVDIPSGESSRPPTDQHPVLPQGITSVTATAVAPFIAHDISGAELTKFVADLRPLSVDPTAGTCTRKGRPQVEFTVHGTSGNQRFVYFGDCDEVSPLGGWTAKSSSRSRPHRPSRRTSRNSCSRRCWNRIGAAGRMQQWSSRCRRGSERCSLPSPTT